MILEPWVLWTLVAATMQSVRTAGQKYLTADISPLAATMVRYLFGLPFALLYLGLVSGGQLPALNTTFVICALLAGALQIIATILLISLFTFRNFAVG
ncbi:MAG: EamA/RhaT family transporter, partial [Pseudomonadales bacterium]|nr:EamA/RhaT family transporter [Pseudomonadales bacterium]